MVTVRDMQSAMKIARRFMAGEVSAEEWAGLPATVRGTVAGFVMGNLAAHHPAEAYAQLARAVEVTRAAMTGGRT